MMVVTYEMLRAEREKQEQIMKNWGNFPNKENEEDEENDSH